MKAPPRYDRAFYEGLAAEVRASASAVVPVLVDLFRPASVLDVGCGTGTWLAAFVAAGVGDVVGVDGGDVTPDMLEIPEAAFSRLDLRVPFDLARRFDLVLSLEVAEHLPPSAADGFVASLVRHGPAVVFSAAVPYQGGAGHLNEQWPAWWAERFAAAGYEAIDCLRPRLWDDARVAWYYAQNTVVYVSRERLAADPALAALHERHGGRPRALVHPGLHVARATAPRRPPPPPSLGRLLRELPGATGRALRRRLGAVSGAGGRGR
jgi:SAM-dependent methyltransferase